ncbi:L-2-hydroxyglutarate oxidase [Candidatus Uabimicrobium amorphum]|uniref:Hydroxyglutarate oxidase n=1 Tax=Uabimicrobium amorphum TaxID=2596890 RepID=A0A5S9F1P4_UABAM|nr:L-2-hydroxyglutarate oxidase [Candidatus Uabimicrobium amorphum]BBM82622.1 hydroxyglutarate oxidase [Candidatus Uabimicrobium amorphum]
MTKNTYDVAVIGAGIVGLATAYTINQRFPQKKIVILEKEHAPSLHQTGRNSGVIHSGIYYRPGSLKARTCVLGVQKLYDFCKTHGVAHNRIGKVIVASDKEEEIYLQRLYERGIENNVSGIEIIDKPKLLEIEKNVNATKGIWVPITGIVDYASVCAKLAEIVKARGAKIVFKCNIKEIHTEENACILKTTQGKVIKSRYTFNCAGLNADYIAKLSGVTPQIRLIPFRGEYYKLIPQQNDLVRGLIYPVPNPQFPFLGVHLTKMIDGSVEMGPNAVLSFKKEGYRKTSFSTKDFLNIISYKGFWKFTSRHWRTGIAEYQRSFFKSAFVKSVRRLMPIITARDMVYYKAGVRAQALDHNGNLVDDFCVEKSHNVFHVLNAPSPAATASLAIAESIVTMSDLS